MLVPTQWHKVIIHIGKLMFPFFHGNSSSDTKSHLVPGQAQSQIRGHSLERWADYCMMDQLPWGIPGKGMKILGVKPENPDEALKGAGSLLTSLPPWSISIARLGMTIIPGFGIGKVNETKQKLLGLCS